MKKWIDLHTHSTISDGTLSPRELVRHAKEQGLAAIALTDHDTVEGIEDAIDEGNKIGLEVIAGLEISAEFHPEMHILGYFFNGTHKNISPVLEGLIKNRNERNPKIVDKLNELGFDITIEEVISEAGGKVVARPHIANVMIKKGYVKSVQDAFERYLGFGRQAFFPKSKLNPQKAIEEIVKAGGLPVIAHPIFLYLSLKQLDELFGELAAYGLKGIEAYYVENTNEDTGNLLRLAIKHNLLATGGSDFHGAIKPGIKIGKGKGNLKVPYELLDKMRAFCE
ncbi:MAG: PHP domain-containing protein [Bacillota bacterium]|nr:PHP domain-containing protein [Bacillota bacterium]